jgi:hypothetical protein
MTATLTADTCDAFWVAAMDDETIEYISFDRCVDWLLNLHETTTDADLQLLVREVLEDLRALGPVEGEFEDVVLGALASVEVAFEIKAAA